MFFSTEEDAAAKSQGTSPAELALDELAPLFEQIEERGEGLALWDGDSWIVAEPSALAASLEDADL